LVAQRKSAPLGITAVEYVAGILEGRFPRVTADELDEADDAAPRRK
jgi:hypothetical protein